MILTDRIKTSWPQYYKVGMCNVYICNYESLKKYFIESINNIVLIHLSDSNSNADQFQKNISNVTGKQVHIAKPGLNISFNKNPF